MSTIRQLGRELRAALARFDPSSYTGTQCAVIADELARVVKACESASARAAARAVACGAHKGSVTESLARAAGRSTGATRAALEAIERVEACPATLEAVVAGEVSLAQAAEITSVPAHETELLALARSSGLGVVKEKARKHRLAAIDPEELHARQHAAQSFAHWTNDLGNVAFRGELPPEIGIPFVNRLDAETDRVWKAAGKDRKSRSREYYAAQAFARMIEEGGTGKTRAPDLVIVVDLRAYRRGHAHEGEVCKIVGNGPIPVRVAREMAKDAFLKTVIHDGVNIHTVAHHGRHIPTRLRTALELGAPPDFDGATCTDCCGRRYHLQWDHVDPKANGGLITFANMKARCIPDHLEKTERDRRAGLLRGKRKERGP